MRMMRNIMFALGVAGLALAVTVVDAQANWGCLAQANVSWSRNWGFDTRAEAERAAMQGCREQRKASERACRLIDCRPNVNTRDDAHAAFPRAGCQVYTHDGITEPCN